MKTKTRKSTGAIIAGTSLLAAIIIGGNELNALSYILLAACFVMMWVGLKLAEGVISDDYDDEDDEDNDDYDD